MAWRSVLTALACGMATGSTHAASPNKMVKVFSKEMGGVTHFYVQNLEAAEVTATFEMKTTNLKGSQDFPYTSTFPGHQTVEAFTLSPVTRGLPWDFAYTNYFTIGNVTAVHDDGYVYSLPYEVGKSFRVTQGYHGKFSHTGPDEYAIDWKMPLGTPVYAARGGVVVKSKDDSDQGGPDRKYQDCANCILIQHSDQTIGIYAHLQKGGNKVKVGDVVKTGDCIGMSGNTGFTSGPHLHFSVFKARNGKERESIPVKFRTQEAAAETLTCDQTYRSVVPAGTEQITAQLPVATAREGKSKS